MKLAATVARVVASLVGALVLVPLGVLVLMEAGVAGAWRWLPGCVVLAAGLAGCCALALWWPRLSADYLVDERGSEDVLRALEDAGFELVGEAGPLPVEDIDVPLSGSVGEGRRYWLTDGRLRMKVTVVSDRMLVSPLQGTLGGSIQVPTSTEQVGLELFDADNPYRLLDDTTELGFWSPDASLEDLEPPPGW